jgi:hypothetical protein
MDRRFLVGRADIREPQRSARNVCPYRANSHPPRNAKGRRTGWRASGRLPEHAGKIVVDRVQMLRGRVNRAELDYETITDDPVSKRLLSKIWSVPCKMDGLTIARYDARLLRARKRG